MSDDIVRQKGTELGKPSRPIPERMREEPSYEETKSKEVGRVADDAAVLVMLHGCGAEGRTSVEFKCSKNGRSVYYPIGISKHAMYPGCLANAVLLVRRDQDSRKPYEGRPHVRIDERKRRNRKFTPALFLLHNPCMLLETTGPDQRWV
jgi:hypothetical protein